MTSSPRALAAVVAICTAFPIPAAAANRAVTPGVFAGDLRTLPIVAPAPDIPTTPRRRVGTHPGAASIVPVPQHQRDPLLDRQPSASVRMPRTYTPPELAFDGQGFAPLQPPDPEGEIGSNYYIQTVNSTNSTSVVIYDKTTGAVVVGPFLLSNLWTAGGDCATDGGGDAIVLFDPLASRWLLSEFTATGSQLCIYVSRSADPIAGGWLNYAFVTPNFPDYPKYAVWPDAYYLTTNEPGAVPVYAFDRAKMLAGLPATMQRFTAPALAVFDFQALTPVDFDGRTPPPAGSPGFFVRHVDDELHSPGSNDPAHDFVEVWQLAVDFATPASSTFGLAATIPVAEFDSDLCGGSLMCVPQPGGGGLDPLREIVMWRAQYRNFGAFQTIVGNFATDVSGADQAGIRWFELHRVGLGAWSLFQEGTYAPDTLDRWDGSIAMDRGGNIALGFSVSSATEFPGMRYVGRLLGSAAGVMDQPEVTVATGVSSQDGDRWGDYAAMNVDPIDDCTFWFTSEYIAAGGKWATRIARFRYDPPSCVDAASPTCGNGVKEVGEDCDGGDAAYCPGLCTGGCACPTPTCGNGVIEVGEQCDGESLGTCASCRPDCTCDLCSAAPEPPGSCFLQLVPGKARVSIADSSDDTKDQLKWSWKSGVATTPGDLGTPLGTGTRYELCVYDGSGASQPLFAAPVSGGGTCDGRSCWSPIGSIGFRYRNKTGAGSHGITQLQLRSGPDGKSQVKAQGKGASLVPPAPALTLPVTVQLVVDDGSVRCWQTAFTVASRNDTEQFSAKGP